MFFGQTLHAWVLLTICQIRLSITMCPVGCHCQNDILQASCYKGGLDSLPIQLNPELRHMNLSCNRIAIVHFLNVYGRLEHLDLSQNRIHTIESFTFKHQKHLLCLNFSHNNISRLQNESFFGLHAVLELDLSNNYLEILETIVFQYLSSLMIFKCSNNRLTYLGKGLFSPSKQLGEIVLDENRLIDIPGQAIGEASVLKVLSLKLNVIEDIRNGDIPALPMLRVLFLKGNAIVNIDENALSKIPSLTLLDISDNNLSSVPTSALAKIPQLLKLDIGGNYITAIHSIAFKGLFHLKRLRLDRSPFLSRIDPRAFVDNMNLDAVWLDNNIELTTLPTRLFHGNPRITQIFIRNNRLTTLEAAHFPVDQLRYLFLGGNPFECNCSLQWLWGLEIVQENKVTGNDTNQTELILDIEDIKCVTPIHLLGVLLCELTEFKLGCTWGWPGILYLVLVVCTLVAAIMLAYYIRSLRLLRKTSQPPKEPTPIQCPVTEPNVKPNEPRGDSRMPKPDITDQFIETEQWEAYGKPNNLRCYGQPNKKTKQRPHIMYV